MSSILVHQRFEPPLRWKTYTMEGRTVAIDVEYAQELGWRGGRTLMIGPFRLAIYGGNEHTIYGWRVSDPFEEKLRGWLLLCWDLWTSWWSV